MAKFIDEYQRNARRHGNWRLPLYCSAAALLLLGYYMIGLESSRSTILEEHSLNILEEGLRRCVEDRQLPQSFAVTAGRSNPRFNLKSGQKDTIWIRNATVFDGERILDGARDILFSKGTITSMIATSENKAVDFPKDVIQVDAQGKWVTPGLVDMHSHHLITFGDLVALRDENEVNDEFGPLTPFVRSLDGLKPYDKVATYIAAGGVTSSLILPGSANIMGGEAFPVKNLLRSGPDGEEVVEELLLQHGISHQHRQRYMKMACGENPRAVYDHTRMGNAWKLREQLAKGKDLISKQDQWCASANAAKANWDVSMMRELVKPPPKGRPGYPESLKLDSTVAMLRGKVNVNIHCYEPEDLEGMIRHSEEFGFPINAFHHAIEAWRVPEMIKKSGQNITIATFQDFAFYKVEAYLASLHAGKIFADHGIPVAYKSDHVGEDTYARYILSQAAGAHSFGLSEELALQSVTSVPAKSMNQGHRIGYIRPAYDADLVIWDSHPLSIGATPVEVYIDGKSTINTAVYVTEDVDPKKRASVAPQIKKELASSERDETCHPIQRAKRVVLAGITKSFTENAGIRSVAENEEKLVMIIDSGKISCFGNPRECVHDQEIDTVVNLMAGHVLPGLTAVTNAMGLSEIEGEVNTQDGKVNRNGNFLDPENLVYAKYGIHLDGKGFDRAKIGGVTRAVTPPLSANTFIKGVSTGFRTTGNSTILDSGIFADNVALHVVIGLAAKSELAPTVSDQIGKLHRLVSENKGKDTIYGKVADGKLPLVAHAVNKYDISQLIKLKRAHKAVKLVILGGHGATEVAQDLADEEIPIIFTAHRGIDDWWEKKGLPPGPPLSKSPTRLLVEAGVKLAIAQSSESAPVGSSSIHNLLLDASWAAKFAGLSDQQAIDLVSTNVEDILDLPRSTEIVVYEGNPLEHGASVAITLDVKNGVITECWPTVV